MVALVIIYNHQFNKNIEILENLYGKRFSNIYHLVPFYNGEKKNVIPVYANSYFFQGYVAQGLKSYFEEGYEHYFFIADDMILNPVINEFNYKDHLKLNSNTCYISRLSTIDEDNKYWPINYQALQYNAKVQGIEADGQLPTAEEAERSLLNFGLKNKPVRFGQIWQTPSTFNGWRQKLSKDTAFVARYFKNKLTHKTYTLSYPLVRSYSDLFVVAAGNIKEFCHYCGVFAATGLFVELAIPTALVFSAKEIRTETEIALQGRPLWTKEDLAFLDKYDQELNSLMNEFPPGYLYLHPVKLSKWKI